MARTIDSFEDIHPHKRSEWRKWLAKNHDRSPGVWFVYFKKHTGKPRVAYDDAVEEALCFGWIDSLACVFDDARSRLLMTPRKPKSVWSKPNKERVEKMVAAGLMTKIGLAKIEQAKADGDGSWNTLDSSDRLEMPEDLKAAFGRNKKAKANWEKFSDSPKKAILYWLGTAKRDETRKTRVEKIVSMASVGKKANFDNE
ncbi:MAG: YdeI/OmpD-associated family protein [Blastocatellia bacterium]